MVDQCSSFEEIWIFKTWLFGSSRCVQQWEPVRDPCLSLRDEHAGAPEREATYSDKLVCIM